MGGWNSGRRDRRPTIEQMHRLPAKSIGQTVRVPMPRGGVRLLGQCPQCLRPVRDLYAATPSSAPACRACHRLSYSSSQSQHCRTRALSRTLSAQPKQLKPMLARARRDLIRWIDAPTQNRKIYNDAMRIFDATLAVWTEAPDETENKAPDDLARPQISLAAIQSEQARIIGEDVVSSEWLINRILKAIAATPDGSKELSRLIHAFVSVSNLREVRAQMLADLAGRIDRETQPPASVQSLLEKLSEPDPEYDKLLSMAQSCTVDRSHAEADDED